jgi:hypothetical protein
MHYWSGKGDFPFSPSPLLVRHSLAIMTLVLVNKVTLRVCNMYERRTYYSALLKERGQSVYV